jgi:hypothetical protein
MPRGRGRSRAAGSFATRSGCGPIGSWWERCAERRRSIERLNSTQQGSARSPTRNSANGCLTFRRHARSSAGIERRSTEPKVTGSNPVGRALQHSSVRVFCSAFRRVAGRPFLHRLPRFVGARREKSDAGVTPRPGVRVTPTGPSSRPVSGRVIAIASVRPCPPSPPSRSCPGRARSGCWRRRHG